LSQDKDYLTRENISLLEKNKRLEDRIDKLEEEVISAKNQAQEYLFQLLNNKNQAALQFEQRINKELNDAREKHTKELEVT
jgi:progesterone-induced-blocking factor 1